MVRAWNTITSTILPPTLPTDPAAMAELLDLDAEVLHSYLSEVIDWVHWLAAGTRHRILHLGSGTAPALPPWPGASRVPR